MGATAHFKLTLLKKGYMAFAAQISALVAHALQSPDLSSDMKTALGGLGTKTTTFVTKVQLLEHTETQAKSLRVEVEQMFEELRAEAVAYGHLAIAVAGSNITKALSFGLSQTAAKVLGRPLLTPPTGLTATKLATVGSVELECDHEKNAKAYVFDWSLDPPTEATWRVGTKGTKRKQTMHGLPPGQKVWFRVSVTTSAGTSPVCEPAMITI